ncbi:MAG: beta-lactamase family protein [Roseivirga sp.]|nr:beta-lactamase family protein [Roseivirga sp.]
MSQFIDSAFRVGVEKRLIPGGVIGVYHQGEVVHRGAYGIANVSKEQQVDFGTIRFQLGSIGKLFTALAVLREVEQGRLELDRDVNEYLNQFQIENPYETRITIRQLLLHNAGFNERIIGYAARSQEDIEPLGMHLKKRMPGLFTQPGSEISYSNYSFGLAGHLVEISSGMKFETYIEQEIFDLLEMSTATYDIPDVNDSGFAWGYEAREEFEMVNSLPRHVIPAGSISLTGKDFMKLISSMIEEDTILLNPNHYELIKNQQFTPHPLIMGHGLGSEMQNFNGHLGFGKAGNIPGFISYVVIMPQYNFGIFVAANTETDNFFESFTPAFFDRFFPRIAEPEAKTLQSVDFDRFTGDYRANRYNRNTVEDMFELFAFGTKVYKTDSTLINHHNGKWQHYMPISPLVFQNTTDPDLYFVFEEDKQGRIIKMHRNVIIGGYRIPVTSEKIPFLASGEFLNEYAAFILVPIILVLFFPFGWLFIYLRRKRKPAYFENKTFKKATRIISLLFSVVILVHIIGGVAPFIQLREQLVFGIPEGIIFFLGISPLIPVLLIVLMYRLFRVWQLKEGTLGARAYLSVYTLSGLFYVLILHQWHFIGVNI